MYVIMGARAPGLAPVRNDFSFNALFPILWMLVSYEFAINLFIGVVVDNFSRIQQEENGSATMGEHHASQLEDAPKQGLKAATTASSPNGVLARDFVAV